VERYRLVADDLERRIDAGEFPPGARLPSWRSLQESYNISRTLVGEAMSVLVARNRIRAKARSGAFVLPPSAPRQRMAIGMAVARNELGYLFNQHAGHWRPLGPPTIHRVPCPAADDVAELLHVEPGTEVVERRRVVGISETEPMQITSTYLSPALVDQAPVVADSDTGPGGWVERVEQDLALGPVSWPVDVITRLPTRREASDLDMPESQPVLVELRLVLPAGAVAGEDPPLAAEIAVRDGRRWKVSYELVRDESAAWPVTPATARNTPEPR
jgi:GntR family transcriptional regulator